MGTVTERVEVNVPLQTAYNQWTQFESFPRFMEGVERVSQLDDAHTHWVTKIGGTTREFDATIICQHPDRGVAWCTNDRPEHSGMVTFEPVGESRTRVTAWMKVEPAGLAERVADKTGLISNRVKSDLKRFKIFIEERGNETGAWRGEIG